MLQVRPETLKMEPELKSQIRQETDQLFIGEGSNCYSFSNLMTLLMVKFRKINPGIQNDNPIRASVIPKSIKMYHLRKAQYLAGHPLHQQHGKPPEGRHGRVEGSGEKVPYDGVRNPNNQNNR
ncbi:hypothetical protein [Echinicola strongylocentroti]|nr:hypothetical protein [Echinicola strongylocentroti]